MKEESFNTPLYLEWFLVGLLSQHLENKNSLARAEILPQILSQDIIYEVTCGPRNHQTIRYLMLIRLGSGVSYTHLEENDTDLCHHVLAAVGSSKLPWQQPIRMVRPYRSPGRGERERECVYGRGEQLIKVQILMAG